MTRNSIFSFFAAVAVMICLVLVAACSQREAKYRIGVSQCSEDIWREKQNAELRMGAYLHDDVELRFAVAYDSDERQVQQIDSLIREGIDLLIVAPNQVATISPAIDRAYDKGIPVIVFERKTNSRKFTAFMSADNYEMGRVMGEYIAAQLHGEGRVLEVMGLKDSSPAIERHRGFLDAMSDYPSIIVVDSLQGDWTEVSGYEAMMDMMKSEGAKSEKSGSPLDIDYVFGQNDRMAIGALKAMREYGHHASETRFCGIDGLPGEDGGIRLVRDSVLDATYIYPTRGDQLIQLAMNILKGEPFEKEVHLMSALVTHENANVLLMESEEIMRQSIYLDQLHDRADNYLAKLDSQRMILWMAFGVIALLLLAIGLSYLYHRRKVAMQRERVVQNLWNMPEASPSDSEETTIPSQAEAPSAVPPSEKDKEAPAPSAFITRFKEVVERRMDDSELSVEDIAADMNLSRVQLYRKVKTLSGNSPVELLRTARLNRGYQLLLTTDKTVSEVAYAVGFSAPAYFTKCFKEEFGLVPGDVRSS